MSGKKGRSGRKKSASTLAREALERNEMMLPTYLQILNDIIEDEIVKDKTVIDTCKYLIDRSQGRVKATHDLRFGLGIQGSSMLLGDRLVTECFPFVTVIAEQESLIKSSGKDVPEYLAERNEIVKVLSVHGDPAAGTVEIEFRLPSGQIERSRGGYHYGGY